MYLTVILDHLVCVVTDIHLELIVKHMHTPQIYSRCFRGNLPYFRGMFLSLNNMDGTANTSIQS